MRSYLIARELKRHYKIAAKGKGWNVKITYPLRVPSGVKEFNMLQRHEFFAAKTIEHYNFNPRKDLTEANVNFLRYATEPDKVEHKVKVIKVC